MRRGVLLFAILLLPLAGGASISGAILSIPDRNTTLTVSGTGFDFSLHSWQGLAPGDPLVPCFDGVCIDLRANDGSAYAWELRAQGPGNITVAGSPTVNGQYTIFGLSGTYVVKGLYATGDFNIQGPSASFTIPAGNQVITILPFSGITSGDRMVLDALWSPSTGLAMVSVALIDSFGQGIPDKVPYLNVSLYAPGNITQGAITMYAGPVPGVYQGWANLTQVMGLNGTWHAVATYNNTVATRILGVGPVTLPGLDMTTNTLTLSTALDSYFPLLVWGVLLLFLAAKRAWFPLVASLLALADSILPTPVMNLGARVMLVVLALMVHIVWKLVADWLAMRRGEPVSPDK